MNLTQQILGAVMSTVVPMALFRWILKLDRDRKARKLQEEEQRYEAAHH